MQGRVLPGESPWDPRIQRVSVGVDVLQWTARAPSPGLAPVALHSVLCPQTERDVSVRQRAVDLLYAMCDRSNAQQIVAEMLSYLETADYSIREEIVSSDVSPWQVLILPHRPHEYPLHIG